MKTVTWAPGTDNKLDLLFHELRDEQYQNKNHRLWKNYSKESFDHAIALTICFDDNGYPELCSSIASRDCWPKDIYRILNRLWKHSNKIAFPKVMSKSFGLSARSQIDWLEKNTNYKLYFMSRQTHNWEKFAIKNFHDQLGITFITDKYKYLTCPNECNDTCWQKIIFYGDKKSLSKWKRQQ
jgi:hypothetical protein